jgi:hypothetical protein
MNCQDAVQEAETLGITAFWVALLASAFPFWLTYCSALGAFAKRAA